MATITIDVPDEVAKALIEKYSKKEFPDWEELWDISWYYVDTYSDVHYIKKTEPRERNKHIRATKAQAEASIAMAQLSQLMKHCNGDWIPDWTDDTYKYTIYYDSNKIEKDYYCEVQRFLSFPTEEKRDWFLEAYRPLIMVARPLL